MLDIAANIKDPNIEFDFTKKNTLRIKTTNGSFNISGQDYKEFPSDPIMKEAVSLTINTNKLLDIIDFTKTSASKDELKPALQGVLLKINNNQILGVSTDGHRLSKCSVSGKLDKEFDELGDPDLWQAEWKWDGIRCQVIKRAGEVYIWSRGEDLITDQFPDLAETAMSLPDGVAIDGELVIIKNGQIQPFNILQARLGRKNVSKKIQTANPAGILAYDIFESEGKDIRNWTLKRRRQVLQKVITGVPPWGFISAAGDAAGECEFRVAILYSGLMARFSS